MKIVEHTFGSSKFTSKVIFEVAPLPLTDNIALDIDLESSDSEFTSIVSNLTVEKAEELVDALQYAILSVRGEL